MVKEDNAPISKYLLSYLQSVFVLDNIKVDPEEVSGDKVIDINKFNTFSVLARINYCLNQKKFEGENYHKGLINKINLNNLLFFFDLSMIII